MNIFILCICFYSIYLSCIYFLGAYLYHCRTRRYAIKTTACSKVLQEIKWLGTMNQFFGFPAVALRLA